MTKYITQERARYWPVSRKLMAQYWDGTHTKKDSIGLNWLNQNGLPHRDGDKPAWISRHGTLEWFQNGKLHRDGDKPARIDANGALTWCQNSQWHRSCGPAEINPDGYLAWWINHEEITHEVKKWLGRKRWHGTPEQIAEFQLRFT